MPNRHPEFDKLVSQQHAHGEHNDCTVKALTAATGLTYADCHAALAAQGRKKGHGCNWYSVGPKAAKALGFDLKLIPDHQYSAKTMATVERDRFFRRGSYVAQVRGHVAAVVDGQVIDWTAGRRHRIKYIYQCTKLEAPEVATMPAGSAKWQAFTKYTKADNLPLF